MTESRSEQNLVVLLASASPRRRQLLADLGWRVIVVPAEVDETPHAGEAPALYVRRLAEAKARAAAAACPQRDLPLIAADTTVVLEGEFLGKPRDQGEAAAMLRRLSGRMHEVWSGVCLLWPAPAAARVHAELTRVWFAALSEEEIATYVASGEPRDKAGGYAIQGRAEQFIPRIEGSYSNVVGLPLAAVRKLLRAGPPATL